MNAIFLMLKIIEIANFKGKRLSIKDFPLDKLKITESQLDINFKNLYEAGYIDGVFIVSTDPVGVKLANPTLTLKGMEYIEENSTMKKVYNALKEAKSWIPGL